MTDWSDLNGAQLRHVADEHLDQAAELADESKNHIAAVLSHGFHALVCEIRACHADLGRTAG